MLVSRGAAQVNGGAGEGNPRSRRSNLEKIGLFARNQCGFVARFVSPIRKNSLTDSNRKLRRLSAVLLSPSIRSARA